MNSMKKPCTIITFTILTLVIILKTVSTLGFADNVHTAKIFDEFYKLPENIVDVVWIGCSSVQEEVNPAVIYEENGIAVYDLSTGNLPFMATKNLIIESEKTQSPLVYLVDIRWLSVETNTDWYIHRITDNMKLSKNRLHSINYMVNGIKKFYPDQSLDLKSLYFPFLLNHSRWESLTKEDFGRDEDVYFGYFIPEGVTSFDRAEVIKRFNEPEIPLSEMQQYFLDDFLDFCDKAKINIVFTNTLNCASEEYFGQYNYIKSELKKRGYEYWDFNQEIDEIKVDYQTDFRDQFHLSHRGGEKFSKYVAQKLADKYKFKGHGGDPDYRVYDDLVNKYKRKSQIFDLPSTTNLNEYLEYLEKVDTKDYMWLVSVKDIQGYFMTENLIKKFEKIGFKSSNILLEKKYHSFIGGVGIEESVIEKYGNDEAIEYSTSIGYRKIEITSETLNTGNESKIVIGNTDYSKNIRGLNFVVIDKKSGEIIDSVAFDTHVPEMTCYR